MTDPNEKENRELHVWQRRDHVSLTALADGAAAVPFQYPEDSIEDRVDDALNAENPREEILELIDAEAVRKAAHFVNSLLQSLPGAEGAALRKILYRDESGLRDYAANNGVSKSALQRWITRLKG